MINENDARQLSVLAENKVITDSNKNLRSKIDSILRAIENLSQKKLRIEFEIKKQRKSLIRKRQELKRVSKTNHIKFKAALEAGNLVSDDIEKDRVWLRRLDSILLQESERALDQD